jgi:GNAT superfamily N-acetyltransferase
MVPGVVTIRRMTPDDAATVAAGHVASWRSAYRGIMADDYLDERAPANRLAHWAARLTAPQPRSAGFIAEQAGTPVGFAFLFGDDDPRYGTLLDNLHVWPGSRSAGIGRALMAACAGEILEQGWQRGLYLWVFAANTGARRFYERHGGVAVEHAPLAASDGLTHPAVRYAWTDASVLT